MAREVKSWKAGLAVNTVCAFMNTGSRSLFTVRVHCSQYLFRSEHGANTPGEVFAASLKKAAAAEGRRHLF